MRCRVSFGSKLKLIIEKERIICQDCARRSAEVLKQEKPKSFTYLLDSGNGALVQVEARNS